MCMRVQLNIKYGSPFKAIAMSEVDRYPYNDYGYVRRRVQLNIEYGIPMTSMSVSEVDRYPYYSYGYVGSRPHCVPRRRRSAVNLLPRTANKRFLLFNHLYCFKYYKMIIVYL